MKVWELPTSQFQILYEMCREKFGPEKITIDFADYRAPTVSMQPTLFPDVTTH
jgi:hypothetical protein